MTQDVGIWDNYGKFLHKFIIKNHSSVGFPFLVCYNKLYFL